MMLSLVVFLLGMGLFSIFLCVICCFFISLSRTKVLFYYFVQKVSKTLFSNIKPL